MVDPAQRTGPAISDGANEMANMEPKFTDDLRQRASRRLNSIRRLKASVGCQGLFGDPAWEILLAVGLTQEDTGTTSTKVQPLTDLYLQNIERWIDLLESIKLVQVDDKTSYVKLTPKALQLIDRTI